MKTRRPSLSITIIPVARKPSISPSKMTTYLACPVKYRWTYVDSRGKWYLKAKSYYSFGTTLHQVLQRFYDSDDAGVTTAQEAIAAYEESWIDAGFNSAEEMAEAQGEGKVMIEMNLEENRKRPITTKTLFVEKQLRMDFGSFDLIGRLDRVDEHENGLLEIIDYKSGRYEVNESVVAEDLALNCYQMLLKERFPDRTVSATMIALRSGAFATATLGDREMIQFRADIQNLGELILTEEFHELTPRPKILCGRCDFVPLCRRHEDFPSAEEFLPNWAM